MKNLRKYPQNILLLLVFLFVCIVLIFFIKEYTSFSFIEPKEKPASNSSLTSLAKFKLTNKLTLGSSLSPLSVENLDGTGAIDLNLLNGDLKINSLNIEGKSFKVNKINKHIKVVSISLDPSHPSVGTINQATGKIDLSAWIMLEMNIDHKRKIDKISLIFPLTGKINKKTGNLNLTGEASLPPDKLGVPMPVEISIMATSY